MNQKILLDYLHRLNQEYEKEGFRLYALFGSVSGSDFNDKSDIDILYEASDTFTANHPGFSAFARLQEIAEEIGKATGREIDLVSKNHLGRIGQKYILDKLIYV